VDIQGSFVDIQGSFVDIQGSFGETYRSFLGQILHIYVFVENKMNRALL